MFKKLLLTIPVLLILTNYAIASMITSPVIKVQPEDNSISVPMSYEYEFDNISAFNGVMNYDPSRLDFVNFTDSLSNKDITFNEVSDGTVNFIMYGLNKDSLVDGQVINAVFNTLDKSGTINVTFSGVVGASPEAVTLPLTINDLVFDIVLIGDFNMDGLVNSGDVMLLTQYLLGFGASGDNLDLNGDGNVDSVDLQKLVNIILG